MILDILYVKQWLWPELGSLKDLRRQAGLTQKNLAKTAGVQQSIISRIEDGKISDPSYSTVKRIFDALGAGKQREHPRLLCAKDVMNPKVVSIAPHKRVLEAWKIMKVRDFTQLPVIDESGRIHGSVSINSLPDAGDTVEQRGTERVADILDDPFPIVRMDTPVSSISALLKAHPATLVMQKGRIVGIITKYDLVDAMYLNPSFLR